MTNPNDIALLHRKIIREALTDEWQTVKQIAAAVRLTPTRAMPHLNKLADYGLAEREYRKAASQ